MESPSVELFKRQGKHATILAQHEDFIAPIKGIDRILGWHTVKGKLHKLAGGQTVLHCKQLEISDEFIDGFFEKSPDLKPLIEEMKIQDKEFDKKYPNGTILKFDEDGFIQ
jgi:hypothetical protein